MHTCGSDCLCRPSDNQRSESIVLDFLEDVNITNNQRSESIVLDFLEDVNITNFRGTDQEEVSLRLYLGSVW
jgi:hypothetical protein